MKKTVLCFMKGGFPHVEAYLKKNFESHIIKSEWLYENEKYDETKYDYVISFLSPWILPKKILNRAEKKAINFHPAPPKYPGSAGYNLAIYNGDEVYGVTCHEMVEKVDSGEIISTSFFPISNESVQSLRHVAHVELESLFFKTMGLIDKMLSIKATTKWECKPHTFKELEKLCDFTGITDQDELERRWRACYYPRGKNYPHIKIKNKKYRLEEVNDGINSCDVKFSNSTGDTIAWSSTPTYWQYSHYGEEECESDGTDDRAD